MIFTVFTSDLLKKVNDVYSVVPSKSILPIIQNIRFIIESNQLFLTATDLEISVSNSVKIDNESGGSLDLAVPAKLLQDTLKALPEQKLTFEIADNSFLMQIKSNYGVYKISCENGKEFPKTPDLYDSTDIELSIKSIKKALDKTLFSASNDELKQNMNGVFLDMKKESVNFVATDGHRLSVFENSNINTGKEDSFILPLKALKLLNIIINSYESETLKFNYNSNNAFFKLLDTTFSCRMVDVNFPAYKQVIPANSSKKLIINKKELLGSLKRLSIYADKQKHLGVFNVSGNELKILAEDVELATEAKEKLNCIYEGEDLQIGFDLSLMNECISKLDTDDVIVELETAGRAAVITPSFQQENEKHTILVMPVVLGSYYS